MLILGWWMVYIIVWLVLIVFWIVCIIIVVVCVFNFDVGLFMKIIDGLVISFIVIVNCFLVFVDKLVILGRFIRVDLEGLSFISFIIFLINVCRWIV